MNLIDRLNKKEIERLKSLTGDRNIDDIPLKSSVSVTYLTPKKEKRIFRGIVIAKSNKGVHSTIDVLKTDSNPGKRLTYKFIFYSPELSEITIDRLCSKRPRRSKLYYLKERFGKNARI